MVRAISSTVPILTTAGGKPLSRKSGVRRRFPISEFVALQRIFAKINSA
jgi:hypothetical protein